MHTIIDIRSDENGRVVLAEARKDKIENPLNLRCIYFEELLSESHFQQLNLIELRVYEFLINLNSFCIVCICADNGINEGQPIVTKPLIKNSNKKKPSAIKQQKTGSDKKKPERGNCYTEPTQPRDNCVTSELYLIT